LGQGQLAESCCASDASESGVQQLEDLQEKIKSAILSALQDAEESAGSVDLREVIKGAVEDALKEAGIDPEQLRQQMPPPPAGMRPPGMGGMMPPQTETSSGTTTESTDSTRESESTSSQTATQLARSIQELLARLWGSEGQDTATQGQDDTILGFLLELAG
jgi:hypothetical protein